MSHGDQDVPARTSDTSVAASGCSAVGLMDSPPPPPPTNVGWGIGGCPAPPLRHPASPLRS